MEETIDLRQYLFLLKEKKWLIVASALICGLVSALVSFFILTPVYEANTSLIVKKEVENEIAEMTTSDDLEFVQQLALTYGEIIKSKTVITSTIDKLGLDMTYEELAQAISITNVSDTQIIKISVQHNNPLIATEICNTIPQIFSEEVQRILNSSGVEVVDKATIPKNPIKPNKTKNIAIGMMIGIMASVSIIFLVELLNTKVKEPKDIEEILGIPVLGIVPKF